MKVNINFKFFSQSVSVGYCLILLGMTIECVYAAVIRPDARWLLILLTFFVDLFCVFDIGRICRSYDIRTDGVVAIWFGIFRRFYPWSSFCSVSWERVNLGCRVVTDVLCTQIPLKRQRNGMVDKEFLVRHPLSCAGYRHDGRTAFRIQQILSHSAIIYSAGGASAPPAGKWTSGHYDAYNRQHTTTDHHRCLLYHAAPQRLRHVGQLLRAWC